MAKILDGKVIAAEIVREVREQVGETTPVVRAVVMDPTPATESYLRIKTKKAEEAGMRLEVVELPESATTEDVIQKVIAEGAHAVIVQLPLPEHIDERKVLDAIPLEKDADVLSSLAYERFLNNEKGALLPPVVGAIAEMLERGEVKIAGKHAVVIGSGRLVGAPAHTWLARMGAEVTVLTRDTFDEKRAALKEADIVVAGAGSPHLITPDLLRAGVVLVDAGTSESNGAIVGDIDPAAQDIASLYTPVPGGVGPVAVACLFKNVGILLQ